MQFIDKATCSLIKSVKSHDGDVLCMCAGTVHGSRSVFASGADSKIVAFVDSDGEWNVKNSIRPHTHDVKALAATKSFLVSGGVDTLVSMTNIEKSFFHNTRKKSFLSAFPSREVIHTSDNGLILFQSKFHLELWELKEGFDIHHSHITILLFPVFIFIILSYSILSSLFPFSFFFFSLLSFFPLIYIFKYSFFIF